MSTPTCMTYTPTSALSCPIHHPPQTETCLHCASYLLSIFTPYLYPLPFESYPFEAGTSDLATSIYPEIEASMHNVYSPTIAPVAKMMTSSKLKRRSRPANMTVSIGPENFYHAIVCREERDFYTERLALSPHEWPTLFAERNYADHIALSPDSVSPNLSYYHATPAGEGKKAMRNKRKAKVVVISDDEETTEPTKRGRVIASRRASTYAIVTPYEPGIVPVVLDGPPILPQHADSPQGESSQKRNRILAEEVDTITVAIKDPIKTQQAQKVNAPPPKRLLFTKTRQKTKLRSNGEAVIETTVVSSPRPIRASKRRIQELSISAISSPSSEEEKIIHAKACRCRHCKEKQVEKNDKGEHKDAEKQRSSKKKRKVAGDE